MRYHLYYGYVILGLTCVSCASVETSRDVTLLGTAAASGQPLTPPVAAVAPRGTPLTDAVGDADFAATLRLLNAKKPAINQPERITELSALHYAAGTDDAGLTVLLLERGADLEAGDNSGLRPLHHAAEQGAITTLPILLAYGAAVNAPGGVYRQSPLQMAVMADQTVTRDQLLDAGASLTFRDRRGLTPLHTAALFGRTTLVEKLIESGADVASPSDDGWTPLHLAACRGHRDTVAALLDRGAAVNAEAFNGSTPLICAAEHGDAATLRVLLSRKADIYARGALFAERQPQAWTALHAAAYKGRVDAIAVLLKANAATEVTNADGKTPYGLALEREQTEAANALRPK